MTNDTVLESLRNHIIAEKARFVDSLKANILRIENELNIKINYSLSETDTSVIVSGLDTYSYFVSKWFPSKIDSSIRLAFNSYSNPHLNENTVKSVLSLSLNDDFTIANVYLKNWTKNTDGHYTDVTFNFDHELKSV